MSAFPDPAIALTALLAGPKFADREFIRSGATFGQVYAMAAWLRAALAGQRGGGVAVCLAAENKAIIAAALLASLGGGPVLLLPYAFSGQALAGMQRATGFVTAIADVDRDFPLGTEVLCPQPDDFGQNLQLPTAAPAAELLRLFTGGSSGTPRIWSKTGLNLFAEALLLAHHYGVSEHDCIAATISPYHIYGLLYSVALPLVSAATVLAPTPSFPEEIIRAVHESGATLLASVPAHYRALRGKKTANSSLRLAFSSAGMLDVMDNTDFCLQHGAGVVEIYGSTETGGIAARNRSQGEEHFTPFPTVAWQIIDHRLHVRSPYISPEVPRDAAGFFISGDRVEGSGDGGFFLQGRADAITKVGGKRVDLEEICRLIKEEPGVADCIVLALTEAGGREHRIATLVEGTAADIDAIRKNLTALLEPYALPRIIKKVSRIPVQPNGKYDRTAIIRLFEG